MNAKINEKGGGSSQEDLGTSCLRLNDRLPKV
jgi:hypothetical protein